MPKKEKKSIQILNEEFLNPGSVHKNYFLIGRLIEKGKIEEYKKFISMFPNGQLANLLIKYLENVNETEAEELSNSIYSLKGPEELSIDLYSNRENILGKMFDIQVRGSGKGEVAIAWLVKNASIQGGCESFDVLIGDKKYEVKDWSNQSNAASILTGVKSKVSNFEFWREVIDTVRRLDKLTGYSTTSKFNFKDYFDNEVCKLVDTILERQGMILSGEFNMNDIKTFKKFYSKINGIHCSTEGFTNIILRGPNQVPIELSINPIHLKDILNNSFTIENTSDDNTFTYILTELCRLKYVRNPDNFNNDMQLAVNSIVEGITYIVFRKDRINITNEFVPNAVSISSLKFIERSLEYINKNKISR